MLGPPLTVLNVVYRPFPEASPDRLHRATAALPHLYPKSTGRAIAKSRRSAIPTGRGLPSLTVNSLSITLLTLNCWRPWLLGQFSAWRAAGTRRPAAIPPRRRLPESKKLTASNAAHDQSLVLAINRPVVLLLNGWPSRRPARGTIAGRPSCGTRRMMGRGERAGPDMQKEKSCNRRGPSHSFISPAHSPWP